MSNALRDTLRSISQHQALRAEMIYQGALSVAEGSAREELLVVFADHAAAVEEAQECVEVLPRTFERLQHVWDELMQITSSLAARSGRESDGG